MNLEQCELINRRAREQAQARNHEMLREIRRRRDEQQERDRRTQQEHHGHGGSILLLLVLLCGLSRRLRRALLMVVAIVAVVAVVAGMVAGIGGSADVQSFAVTSGILAVFGGGLACLDGIGVADEDS